MVIIFVLDKTSWFLSLGMQTTIGTSEVGADLGPLLLTWLNFNTGMDS